METLAELLDLVRAINFALSKRYLSSSKVILYSDGSGSIIVDLPYTEGDDKIKMANIGTGLDNAYEKVCAWFFEGMDSIPRVMPLRKERVDNGDTTYTCRLYGDPGQNSAQSVLLLLDEMQADFPYVTDLGCVSVIPVGEGSVALEVRSSYIRPDLYFLVERFSR